MTPFTWLTPAEEAKARRDRRINNILIAAAGFGAGSIFALYLCIYLGFL